MSKSTPKASKDDSQFQDNIDRALFDSVGKILGPKQTAEKRNQLVKEFYEKDFEPYFRKEIRNLYEPVVSQL